MNFIQARVSMFYVFDIIQFVVHLIDAHKH